MRYACSSLLSLLVLGMAVGVAGCFAEGYSMKDRFTEAQKKYNEGVRWNRYEDAIPYLPKDEQHVFVDRMTALEDELEIADSEMVQFDLDKKRDRATARMVYTWTLKRRGLVEKTSTEQTWVDKGGKWTMIHEVRMRGAALPLWKERSEVVEEPDAPPSPFAQGSLAGGPGPGTR
jgi:hypothetical protein